MKHLLSLLPVLWIVLGQSSLAVAGTIKHIRGKVTLLNERGNKALAREEILGPGDQILLPLESQIQIAWDIDSFLEVIGPARFRLNDNRLILEFGRFLFFSMDSYPLRVRVLDETVRPSSETALEVDIPMHRMHAQFLLFDGNFGIAGQDLEASRLYLLDQQKLQEGNIDLDFAQQRRAQYNFTKSRIEDVQREEGHKSYRNQIILSLQAHLLRFLSVGESSSFVQNTLGFAPSVEWNHKRYWNIVKHPSRVQYLRAPALRLGLGTHLMSTQVRPTSAVSGNSQFLGAHAVSGFSWLGLSIEGVVTYQTTSTKAILLESPLGFGLRTRYEWDLFEVTQSDIMFSLGYSHMLQKLKAGPTLIPPPSTQPFQTLRHGLDLSFHLNF